MNQRIPLFCLMVLTGVLVFRQLKEEKRDEEFHKKRLEFFDVEIATIKPEKTGKVLTLTPKDENHGNGKPDNSDI